MKLWIDTSACATDETFHVITTTDDGYKVTHGDDTPCDDTEFKFEEDDDHD